MHHHSGPSIATTPTTAPPTAAARAGLLHAASSGGSCNDGNACTTGDTCSIPCNTAATENFDGVTAPALPAGWTTQLITGQAGDMAWVTATTAPDSRPNSGFTDDVAHVTDKVLVTPVLINGATSVTFRNRYGLEATLPNYYDGMVLEIKIGAGAFQDILAAGGSFVTGGYNGTISTAVQQPDRRPPGLERRLGGGATPAYVTTTATLPPAASGQADPAAVACGDGHQRRRLGRVGRQRRHHDLRVPLLRHTGRIAQRGHGRCVRGRQADVLLVARASRVALRRRPGQVPAGRARRRRRGLLRGRRRNLRRRSCLSGSGRALLLRRCAGNTCAAPGSYGTASNGSPRITTTCP
jgi:hypothetical protein